jgi:hypothetical protein
MTMSSRSLTRLSRPQTNPERDEQEDHDISSVGRGASAPRFLSPEARMIIAADRQRRAVVDDIPLPRDPTAKMIAQFAREIGQAPQARTDGLSPAARLILNASKAARGENIDEAV